MRSLSERWVRSLGFDSQRRVDIAYASVEHAASLASSRRVNLVQWNIGGLDRSVGRSTRPGVVPGLADPGRRSPRPGLHRPVRPREDAPLTILFLHGWHSVPGGVKPSHLGAHGYEVINPALSDD